MAAAAKITRLPGKASEREAWLGAEHDRLMADIAPGWLSIMCAGAMETVIDRGLPTPSLERWKYTNLGRALGSAPLKFGAAQIESSNQEFITKVLNDQSETVLRIVSVPDDYGYASLWHLNTAFLRDCLLIDIPDHTDVRLPLDISVKCGDGLFTCPRLVIRLGKQAALTIIERHAGQGRYWKNMATQIVLGDNATLRHYRLQEDDQAAIYTQTTEVRLSRDAHYEAFTLSTGGKLSRNQIHAELNGTGGQCMLYGLNLQRGQQQADATMLIEHRAAHCNSNQMLRTVLDDQARGVYQGKVYVHRDAQKTDGYQLSNTLLLSEGAEMDTKPELEIYADDVKCSHGATTGRLDDEPLFYMRARGIPEKEARAMLIEAFMDEVVNKLSHDAIKPVLMERVRAWLG